MALNAILKNLFQQNTNAYTHTPTHTKLFPQKTLPIWLPIPFLKKIIAVHMILKKKDLMNYPKGNISNIYLCIVRRNRMKISGKQALQKFHLPNGHVGTKISWSGSLSLFIGYFDASTYKSIIRNATFNKSIHLFLDWTWVKE